MVLKLPEEKALPWKTKKKEIKIRSLKQLCKVLIDMKQENIDKEINSNVKQKKLLNWVEENFPNQMEMIAILNNIKEFTPQQIRERIVRILRKII